MRDTLLEGDVEEQRLCECKCKCKSRKIAMLCRACCDLPKRDQAEGVHEETVC